MSANKEKMEALVDFLTAVFIIVMLVVVKMSQNRHNAERTGGHDMVCESAEDRL